MEFVTANDRQECKPPNQRILQLLVGSSFKWDVYREKLLCKYLWDPIGIRSARAIWAQIWKRSTNEPFPLTQPFIFCWKHSPTRHSHSTTLPLFLFRSRDFSTSDSHVLSDPIKSWENRMELPRNFNPWILRCPQQIRQTHMYVYTHVYIYIWLYMHICYIYWSAVKNMCMNTCIYIRVHILYVYMHIPVDTCMNMYR